MNECSVTEYGNFKNVFPNITNNEEWVIPKLFIA